MVRAKVRYLVVAVVEEESSSSSTTEMSTTTTSTTTTTIDTAATSTTAMTTTSLYRHIRRVMTQSFGLISHRIDFQVRYCRYGIALLRVNRRDDCATVRAVLTLLSGPVQVNVLSLHGSLRTARLAAIQRLRRVFRHRIQLMMKKKPIMTTTTTIGVNQTRNEQRNKAKDDAKDDDDENFTKKALLLSLGRQMDEAVTAILDLPN